MPAWVAFVQGPIRRIVHAVANLGGSPAEGVYTNSSLNNTCIQTTSMRALVPSCAVVSTHLYNRDMTHQEPTDTQTYTHVYGPPPHTAPSTFRFRRDIIPLCPYLAAAISEKQPRRPCPSPPGSLAKPRYSSVHRSAASALGEGRGGRTCPGSQVRAGKRQVEPRKP